MPAVPKALGAASETTKNAAIPASSTARCRAVEEPRVFVSQAKPPYIQ